jgi:hypothetical protein
MGPKKYNNKNKPLGSGTISNARRLKRQQQFGEPWSSSSSWWHSNEADWQQQPSSSSTWGDSSQQGYQGQHQGADVVDDSRDTSSPVVRPAQWLAAPVTPPWKKEESEPEVDAPEEPPHPWKLIAAREKVEMKAELSSSSNSDDWGKDWKGSKHPKEASGESIVMDEPHLKDAMDDDDADMEAQSGSHLYPAVAIDWHNVLEVKGRIDEASLEKLIQHGVECTICSYCFKNTAAKVIRQANQMRCSLDLKRIEITEERTGPGGKCDLYEKWCIDVLFDDAEDICREGLQKGLHVYPICTPYIHHEWYRELGGEPYATFADAVNDFLKTYGPGGKN